MHNKTEDLSSQPTVSTWIWPKGERDLKQKQLRSRQIRHALTRTWILAIFLPVAWIASNSPPVIAFAVVLVAVLVSILVVAYAVRSLDDALDDEKVLQEEFGTVEERACLVGVRITQGSILTGVDRGIIWLESDGRLTFSGHACSFAIAPAGVRHVFPKMTEREVELTLLEPGPGGVIRIGLRQLRSQKTWEGQIVSLVKKFEDQSVYAVSQLPPLDIGPGGVQERVVTRRILIAFAIVLISAIAISATDGISVDMVILGAIYIVVQWRLRNSLANIRRARGQ